MRHDLDHEMKQNQAIEHLALAVQGLAMRIGASEYKRLCEDVLAMLKADEDEIDVSPEGFVGVSPGPVPAEDLEAKPE